MEKAKLLLEKLTERVPPGAGQRHNITLADDKLVITLMLGATYTSVLLGLEDFDKLSTDLADEIYRLAKPEIDRRKEEPPTANLAMSTNKPQWKKTRDELPKVDKLVLVQGVTHEGVALGQLTKEGTWDVQPFRGAWYYTFALNGIRLWRGIDDDEDNQPAA